MSLKGAVKAVEQQLNEAGEKLLQPPSSVEELIALLDLAENALAKVEQSPGKSMHDALSSLRKALVSDELLGHTDTDVKVSVASCISEITRITAPDAPYDDEKMKRVFKLIVSSFENLSDKSSRSYTKRAVILETVAKVRSCVIMLDLECDDLITEMFQIFFRTIRDYHPDSIFTSMETIMNLVLEESEEVSNELLTTLLSSVKRDNEEVLPIARRLGERILRTSAVKLKPYLTQAIKYSGISIDNYSNILTSVTEGTVGEDASNALIQKPSDVCKDAAASIEVTQEGDAYKAAVASSEATQEGDGSKAATASSEEIQVDDGNKATVVSSEGTREGNGSKTAAASSEETQEDAKDAKTDCLGDMSPSAKRSSNTMGSNGTNMTSKEKASVKGELSQKEETSDTDNKSTNDEEIPKPGSHALGVEKSTVSASKSKKTSKNRRKKASSSKKSVESSEPSQVDSEKEAKILPNNLDCHEKDTDSLRDQDMEVKNVKSDKQTADIEADKDTNADSPSPGAGEAEESLPKDGHQQEKESVSQGEVSSPERVTEKENERVSDSGEASGESLAKETPQESPLKDESSVEIGTSKPVDSTSSDSEDKPVKKPAKKLDLTDSDDDLLLKKKTDSIKRARTKVNRPGKGASKSSTKNDVNEAVSSQNRTAKSAKTQGNEGEILSKRKRSMGKEEASGPLKYGKNLIRERVKVWWPMDHQFYLGKIVKYYPDKRKHEVVYEDGEIELLNLKKEKWQLIGNSATEDNEPASTDTSSEMPRSKKVKKGATSSVKQHDMDDVSPKRLSASSSRSKGGSSRSGKWAKNGKAETKSKDVTSKSGAISEDESGGKSKAHSQSGSKTKSHNPKLSGKPVNDAPKSSGKAKDLDNSTPKSKSKEDTPKISGKYKENTPKSGKSKDDTLKTAGRSKEDIAKTTSKSIEDTTKTAAKGKNPGSGSKASVNGASKVKFSFSKGKGSHVQDKPSESSEVSESTKRKLSDSSKDQESEAKSEKKRRRTVKG